MSVATRFRDTPAETPRPQGRDAAATLHGLDGLRAIAVLAVVFFHLHAAWLPGGFLGVDVFFVISGFLITTLLLREHAAGGRLDLRRFWLRRARRLLPALLVLVPVVTLLARLIQPDLLVGIGRQTFGALTFSSNWLEIAAGSDYFHATTPQLLMNLWSLAVEEQFYLLWPLAALFIVTRVQRSTARAAIPLGLAAASTLLMALLLTPASPTRVYYGTDTHLVGLMLGAALAFAYAAPHRAWTTHPQWLRARRPAIVAAGLTLLTLFVFLDESSAVTFRGGIALAAVASAVLILAAVSAPGGLRLFLDGPLLAWVGQRSYGIYLWHWPVILLLDQLIDQEPGGAGFVLVRLAAFALTLVIAEASYRWLEIPVRQKGFRAFGAEAYGRALTAVRGHRPVLIALATVVAVAWAATVLTAPRETTTEATLRANAASLTTDAPAPATSPTTGADNSTGSAPGATSSPIPTASGPMPTGSDIDVYGDSMVVGSIPALRYYFPGIRIDGRSNRHWSDGLAAVKAAGHGNRKVVILAFGTNAGMDEKSLTAILNILASNRLVVLVNEHGSFARVAEDNKKLAAAASGRANVVVADWNAALKGTSGNLQSDGIHPSQRGQHLYAKTIRAALADLVTQRTGQKITLPDLPIP